MKCRNIIKNEKDKQNIVWFGSYGLLKYKTSTDMSYSITLNIPISSFVVEPNGRSSFRLDFESSEDVLCHVEVIIKDVNDQPLAIIYEEIDTPTINNKLHIETNNIFIHNYVNGDHLTFIITTNAETIKSLVVCCNKSLKNENYVKDQHGVAVSLIQRLSIMKGELWYKASYGLPLTDKIKNKGIYDSIIINIINSHPDVKNITYFNSKVENHQYQFNFIVNTIYSEEVEINYIL